MINKNYIKGKLILFSTISIASISMPFLVFNAQNNSTSNLNYVNNNSKQASSFDYVPISNNITTQPVSTSVGFLGTNQANNALYLTSYEGVTVWQSDVINNQMVKSFYKDSLNINDISSYTIKSWKYLKNIDVIAVILSDSQNNNVTIFGVRADTGLIYAPILDSLGNPKPDSNMIQVNNGTDVLWENSSGQVIATIFGDYNTYSNNTFLISFSTNGVSKFNASVRNIAVNPNNAKSMVDSKVGKSETINNNSIRYNSKNWTADDGSRWKIQAVIEGTVNSNTNIAVFTDITSFCDAQVSSTTTPLYLQQAVLVDDNLNPIFNSNNQPIVYTLNKFIAYFDKNNIWTGPEKLQRYGYIGKSSGNNQNFIWLTSGIWNAATQLTYDSTSKVLSQSKVYDLQWESDQDVYTYSYDVTENRLFTSNTYTSSDTGIGYIDFDDSQLAYKKLVAPIKKESSGDIPLSYVLKFSPVTSDSPIQETPIVYFDPNDTSKIKGLYFDKNSSNSITKELTRKAYEDIQTKAKSLQWYTTKSASTVSKEEALQALVYDGQPLNGKFENSVENLKGNDENGTLNVRYKTTYENWWDTSKSSSFYVETTITGMYAMNGSSFNFVTVNNGNTENDEKLKEQNKFKESAYPSSVKWEDIEKYFIIANIKDISQNVIKLDESMITLKPDDEKGILEVTVDYTKKLPSGLPSNYLTYKNEFSGFLNLQGYNYHILTDEEQNKSNEIKEIKQNSFPSELSVQQYLDNFITLGQSYSRNVNDWDFNVVADDYKGSLIINLTYNPKATPLPANFPENYKKIVKDVTVNGFKNITEQFKTIKVKNYVGIKNADDIWNEYEKILNDGQNNFISTSLASLISVPYVDNFADLTIGRNNSENPNVLDLTVSVKVGTTTRLLVNRQNFTFDSTTESKFKENKLDYPYKVQINVETIEQAFLWKKPDGQTVNYTNNKAETIKINLNDYQYKTINSNMYADEVTEQDIKNLFEAIGFINIKISLQTDNQDGIVYATVSLNSTDNFDVEQNANKSIVQLQSTSNDNSNSSNINTNTIPDGSVFVKRFEISGFKKPVSPVVITITSSVIAVIVLFSIIFLVYLKVIRKNLHKVIINKEDKKFVKKIELKNQIKKNRMIKRNRKKLIKRINH